MARGTMTVGLAGVCTAVLLATSAAAAELPKLSPPRTGHVSRGDAAVVVGIERYAAMTPVPYAEDDAAAFTNFLLDTVGVPRDRVDVLKGEPATKRAILDKLRVRAAQVKPGGTFWVFFSGHGAPTKDDDVYLMGWSVGSTPEYWDEASVRQKALVRLADSVPEGARSVVVLDACFSGKDRGGRSVVKGYRFPVRRSLARGKRAVVWSAAQGDQFAGPLDPARHGLFTYFVVGGLSGWADAAGNHNGRVDLREAERYVNDRMRVAVRPANRAQEADLRAPGGAGRWVLASLGARGRPGPDDATLERAVEEALKKGTGGGVVTPVAPLDKGEHIENTITDDTGFLEIDTEPDGARISLNGEEQGTSPKQVEKMVGRYVVVAEMPLYHAARQELKLGTDGVKVTLRLPPAFGGLVVESEPPGAQVVVDDRPVGRTPWRDERRPSGRYRVQVTRDLYFSFDQTAEVRDGEKTRVVARLRPNSGGLVVESTPPGAAIALNNAGTGERTPHTFHALQPGVYAVKLTLAGYGDAVSRETVENRRTAKVSVRLTAKLGLLSVMAETGDGHACRAALFVDGAPSGKTTPAKLRLPEGEHELRVRCGRVEAVERVVVRHNQKARVKLVAGGGATSGEWVRIRGGTFQMGSNHGESDEKPVHRVKVASFEMNRTEVTVAQYRACVEAGKCRPPKTGGHYNWGESDRDDHPVNGVSWNDAKAYCEGYAGARLPTEEEWEYAARGREGRKYAWGDTPAPSCRVAVMDDGGDGCGRDSTWPVCSKPAGNTPEGLCDMSGNVWEWTASPYCSYPSKNCANAARVSRGGCWYNVGPSWLRGAFRSGSAPENRWNILGFRCARD